MQPALGTQRVESLGGSPVGARAMEMHGKGDGSIDVDPVAGGAGLSRAPRGVTPAVVLVEPQFAYNVGHAVRACSCWGFRQLWWTGGGVTLDVARGERLPREERLRGYRDVQMIHHERPLDQFDCSGDSAAVPVAVELR